MSVEVDFCWRISEKWGHILPELVETQLTLSFCGLCMGSCNFLDFSAMNSLNLSHHYLDVQHAFLWHQWTRQLTQSVWSKRLLPKSVRCVLKRESQFLNNPDPTPNFLSTPTMKSAVFVHTDHVSTGMQSRPAPSLMSQSMTKGPVQHMKLPQILLGAMFACLRNKKRQLFSICFQSTGLRNNSNDSPQFSVTHALKPMFTSRLLPA